MRLFLLVFFFAAMSGCQSERNIPPLAEPDFILTPEQTHNQISKDIPPVLHVHSGAVLDIFTKEASGGQFQHDSDTPDIVFLNKAEIFPLTGPIFIKGAEPGDILAVTFLSIATIDWGWTAIVPNFGLLQTDFSKPWIKSFHFGKGRQNIRFNDAISLPLAPFPGVVAVAPNVDKPVSAAASGFFGGNIDDPDITTGTTLYLPVFAPGALLSLGDGQAAQGRGEVSGIGISAPLRLLVKVEILKKQPKLPGLQYENNEIYAVVSFGKTLEEAVQKATQQMINYLMVNHNLAAEEAYALCSVACNLKINQVVNRPHVNVSMQISKNIFSGNEK